jgi:hypothetical protein
VFIYLRISNFQICQWNLYSRQLFGKFTSYLYYSRTVRKDSVKYKYYKHKTPDDSEYNLVHGHIRFLSSGKTGKHSCPSLERKFCTADAKFGLVELG